MLSKRQIKQLAGSVIYNRGLELYYQDKVMQFCADELEEEEIGIRARVKGSGRKEYNVELVYHKFYEDLSESYCECPAFFSYAGICKHFGG